MSGRGIMSENRLRDAAAAAAAAAWWSGEEIAVISHDEVVGFAESGCIVATKPMCQ